MCSYCRQTDWNDVTICCTDHSNNYITVVCIYYNLLWCCRQSSLLVFLCHTRLTGATQPDTGVMSSHLFVRLVPKCEHYILHQNEWINLDAKWHTSCPWSKGMKRSTLGIRRSKVKVARGRLAEAEASFLTCLGWVALAFLVFVCCSSEMCIFSRKQEKRWDVSWSPAVVYAQVSLL